MAPDNYEVTLSRIAETIDTLRDLDIPAEMVHSLSIKHWSIGAVVEIYIGGATEDAVALVNRIADHYALPPEADPYSGLYARRGRHFGSSPVCVLCGRPKPQKSGVTQQH